MLLSLLSLGRVRAFPRVWGPSPPVKASPGGRGRKGGDLQTRTNKGGRKRTVHLDAVASRFTHKDPALVIHRHAGWPPKILFPFEPVGTLALCPHLPMRAVTKLPSESKTCSRLFSQSAT